MRMQYAEVHACKPIGFTIMLYFDLCCCFFCFSTVVIIMILITDCCLYVLPPRLHTRTMDSNALTTIKRGNATVSVTTDTAATAIVARRSKPVNIPSP